MSSFLVRGPQSSASSRLSSPPSSSFSSLSSASNSPPMIQASYEVNQFALAKIEEIIAAEIELNMQFGTPLRLEDLPTEEQLQQLVNGLVRFIRKTDQLQSHEEISIKRVDDYLKDAAWIYVGNEDAGTSVLMLDSHKLGEGGECTVYSGLSKNDGTQLAVKVRNEALNDPSNEIEMFRLVSHSPYIVKRFSSSEWYQIEEVCSKGSLHYIRKNEKQFMLEHLRKINEGILGGLAHFHACGIIYGDTKPENLLMTETGEVKFSDLGQSYFIHQLPKGGTHIFYAPEQIFAYLQVVDHDQPKKSYRFPEKTDIWQAMLTLAQINKDHLSEPFRKRLKEYRYELFRFANEAEGVKEDSLNSGDSKYMASMKGNQHFMRQVFHFFDVMHKNRIERKANIEGLFSDLQPTTPLEELVVRMSYYDSNKRMSADQALEFFRSYCV